MRTSVYSKARVGPRAQPIWNEHFDLEIREPELTVLQIQAMDKDGARDEFLAHYDVAVSALREGAALYRCSRATTNTYTTASPALAFCASLSGSM